MPWFDEYSTCTMQSIDADSATVSWPALSTARFYYIFIESNKFINTTSNVYRVTDLKPVTDYVFIVTVYGIAGSAGNSVECRGKTGLYL